MSHRYKFTNICFLLSTAERTAKIETTLKTFKIGITLQCKVIYTSKMCKLPVLLTTGISYTITLTSRNEKNLMILHEITLHEGDNLKLRVPQISTSY